MSVKGFGNDSLRNEVKDIVRVLKFKTILGVELAASKPNVHICVSYTVIIMENSGKAEKYFVCLGLNVIFRRDQGSYHEGS